MAEPQLTHAFSVTLWMALVTRADNEILYINTDQFFKKPQIAIKNPSCKKYNI